MSIREKMIDIILKVAMSHHDDISKQDEDNACDAADELLSFIQKEITGWLPKETCPIIRALDKRLKCDTCSHIDCKSKIKNGVLSDIRKRIEEEFKEKK